MGKGATVSQSGGWVHVLNSFSEAIESVGGCTIITEHGKIFSYLPGEGAMPLPHGW